MTTSILQKLRESGPLTRTATIIRSAVNTEKRTVEIAFSSEEPYRRWFGLETLGHAAGEADLSFLASGSAPFLDGHDTRRQIGVIEKAWIDGDRKGRAVVRFSKNPAAQEVFQDITDGIRQNISVGYEVESMSLVSDNEKEGKTYRVDRWAPLEASVVAIPADRTVGVGRTANHDNSIKRKNTMNNTSPLNDNEKGKELNRIREIAALGAHPQGNFKSAAEKAIADGTTVDQFRAYVLDELKKKGDTPGVNADPRIGLSVRTDSQEPATPFRDAIMAMCPEFQQGIEAGRAREHHQEMVKRTGKTSKGMIVDMGERSLAQRDMVTNLGSAGGYMVGTQLMPMIDSLNNAALCILAGAQTITGLVGDVAFPKVTADLAAAWIGEGGEAQESIPDLGQLRMTPKTLSAQCVITRRLMLQTSGVAERFVRMMIARQFGIGIDSAAINGAGTPNVPRGILQTTGIGSVTLNAANTPTWTNIVGMETEVSTDNALDGRLAYMTGATIAGNMKVTEKASGTAKYLLEDGKSNGYPVLMSNNVPAKHIIFGNWADVLVGFWSGIDILADPYTGSKKGEIIITAFIDCDVIIRHAESFVDGYKA